MALVKVIESQLTATKIKEKKNKLDILNYNQSNERMFTKLDFAKFT